MIGSVFVAGLNNAPHILSWERRFYTLTLKIFSNFFEARLFLPRKPLFSEVSVGGNRVIIHIKQS